MSGDFNRSYVVTDNGNGTFTVQSVAYDGSSGTTRINDNDPIGDPLTIGEAIIEDNGALPPFNSGTFYGYVGAAAPSGVLMAVTGGTDGLAGNIVLFTNDTYPLSQVISFTSGTTAFCFAEGTSIATTKGEVYVEICRLAMQS
ncbi:hypothetical protein [Nioella sp.]|uniref:hypothetical protein n=1 Tax=Nioella sp. TaxID=1912091 RepID=UPI003A850CAA